MHKLRNKEVFVDDDFLVVDGKSTMRDEVVASDAQDHIVLTIKKMEILVIDIKNDPNIKVREKDLAISGIEKEDARVNSPFKD